MHTFSLKQHIYRYWMNASFHKVIFDVKVKGQGQQKNHINCSVHIYDGKVSFFLFSRVIRIAWYGTRPLTLTPRWPCRIICIFKCSTPVLLFIWKQIHYSKRICKEKKTRQNKTDTAAVTLTLSVENSHMGSRNFTHLDIEDGRYRRLLWPLILGNMWNIWLKS